MTELAQPSPREMESEASRILERANSVGVTLRLLGALAFERRCPQFNHLRLAMGRELSDLDFAALLKQWNQVVDLVGEMGYSFDERRAMLHGNDRVIFFHANGFRVDIFFDRLDMCHVVDFRERLDIDKETISVTDLFLEKVQIVELTRKDVIDTIVLLREHEVGSSERNLNIDYLASIFRDDWGFYYTATENLNYIREKALQEFEALGDEDRSTVENRIDSMLERLEAEPKTLKWRIRAAIGPRVRWYKDVGELAR
jgi:hypothetical protein